MLALVVAQHGPVRDGLVALLEASPDINKIVQIKEAESAWDFVQAISPNITLIYATSLTQEISTLIAKLNGAFGSPILAIVASEEDRIIALDAGADVAVLEGLPSSKLAIHIAQLSRKQYIGRNANPGLPSQSDRFEQSD